MMIDKTKFSQDRAQEFDRETSNAARASSVIGYFLFFVPLIMHPESKFARYHANQSMVLLLLSLIGNAFLSLIPAVGAILVILMSLFIVVCVLRGCVLAMRGRAKRVPFFGRLILIEYSYAFSLEN